jgi:hypothetical protein
MLGIQEFLLEKKIENTFFIFSKIVGAGKTGVDGGDTVLVVFIFGAFLTPQTFLSQSLLDFFG